jgi:phosphatidylglycerol:prolipoprotein diacylglycerol transferase
VGKKSNKTRSKAHKRRTTATRSGGGLPGPHPGAMRTEPQSGHPLSAGAPHSAVSVAAADYLRSRGHSPRSGALHPTVARAFAPASTAPPRPSAQTAEPTIDTAAPPERPRVHTAEDIAPATRQHTPDRPPANSWADAFSQVEPLGLAATYWGVAADVEPGEDVSIRFTGVRVAAEDHPPTEKDRFERTLVVESLPPAGGRFAATTRIQGIASGEWQVSAHRIDDGAEGTERHQSTVLTARTALLSHGPAVRVWSWPALVAAGAVVALILQGLLLSRTATNVAAAVSISVLSCVLGYIGAKVWYSVLHRRPIRAFIHAGACIQGFLLVALGTLTIGGALGGMDVGAILDATTPGLFLGMAIGRPGCFLAGCCSGRPTESRWGLFSSDRTLATKRIPVQLYEAAAALLIAGVALAVVLQVDLPVGGLVFLGSIAAYTLVRQGLFLFRVDAHTRRGRLTVSLICCAILIGVVAGSQVLS